MTAEEAKKAMDDLDKIYRETPPGNIPWNITQRPQMLADMVTQGTISPCKAIDLGCGLGNYSIWLAQQGFAMTGVDVSPTAVKMAVELASESGVKVNFVPADLTTEIKLTGGFDFAFDWEVLHHIYPDKRALYIKNVHQMLNPGGKYLSVCFSEQDPFFGGSGKYRTTPIGTHLYFSSEEEMRELFGRYFEIIELATKAIPGKNGEHLCIVGFMEHRQTLIKTDREISKT